MPPGKKDNGVSALVESIDHATITEDPARMLASALSAAVPVTRGRSKCTGLPSCMVPADPRNDV